MAEDIKPEMIKKTQDILGKFIKKPTLTEKLLKKPPFRFLHDICTSVMKETGFLNDVLVTESDKIENIKDKEGKIEFLQKVIGAVESANGKKLSVKPSKIVAGLEPTRTNELLQALGKAIEKQLENKDTKTSQPMKTKSIKKATKEVKDEPPDKKKSSSNKTSKKLVENEVLVQNDKQVPSSPKNKSTNKLEESEHKSDDGKMKEVLKMKKNELLDKKPSEKNDDSSTDQLKNVPQLKVNESLREDNQNLISKGALSETEVKRGHSGNQNFRRDLNQNEFDQIKNKEENQVNESICDSVREKIIDDNLNTHVKSEIILKEQNRATPSPSGQNKYTKKDSPLMRDGTIISRPRTELRPTTARPASARPAAPRIRDRGEIPVVEEVMKPASGKVQVIEEKEVHNEAEDEILISLETSKDILLEEPSPNSTTPTSLPNQEHGHLVEQILEVQRELEDGGKFSHQKTSGKTEIEWEFNKNKELMNREIEKLRSNIQVLTRTTNPLGKLLYFFQEDIDTVQKELETWKEKNSRLSLEIAHERSITDQLLEPLKIHLKEIQQSIDEQLGQISVVKANIIKNNEKIHKLLTGI